MAIAAILLAAGSSRRFGATNKLLVPVSGEPLVRRTAIRLTACERLHIIAVTGPDRLMIEQALADLKIAFVHNPRHAEGMGTSIAAGIRALADGVTGCLIVPADLPELDPSLIDRELDLFEDSDSACLVVPRSPDGGQRNPVLWPRKCFPALASIDGDNGGKSLLQSYTNNIRYIDTDDDQPFIDIDTPDDISRLYGPEGSGHDTD